LSLRWDGGQRWRRRGERGGEEKQSRHPRRMGARGRKLERISFAERRMPTWKKSTTEETEKKGSRKKKEGESLLNRALCAPWATPSTHPPTRGDIQRDKSGEQTAGGSKEERRRWEGRKRGKKRSEASPRNINTTPRGNSCGS